MKRFFCYSVSLAVLGAATSPAHASDLLSVTKGEELFFEHLQAAVLTCNTNWFATNLDYPITIKVGASTKVLARASDLNPWAPAIFDRQLQKKVQQQSPRFLVKNWQGVSVADGAFWFSEAPAVKKGRKSGCKVIGMNLPAKETWVSNIVAGVKSKLPNSPSSQSYSEMEKQNREFFAELAGGCDTLLTDVSLGKVHSGDVLAGFDGALSKPIRALKAYEVIPKTDRVLIRMGREGMDYSLIWEPDAGHAGRKHLLIERNGEQKRVYSRYE